MPDTQITSPKKISPCPIIEALVEFRFKTTTPAEAILGFVYSKLRNDFPGGIEKLPILQLPENIRANDPNLKNLPWYKIHQDSQFFIQLGPRVLSFVNTTEYIGWEHYSGKIAKYFGQINEIGIVESIERIGVRYINFFNYNVYEKTTLEVNVNGESLSKNGLSLKASVPSGRFMTNVSVSSNTDLIQNVNKPNMKKLHGSVVDIDTYIDLPILTSDAMRTVEDAHAEEKRIFYSWLKKDFISTLNPEY